MKAMVVLSVLGVSGPLQTKETNLLFVSSVKSQVITAQVRKMSRCLMILFLILEYYSLSKCYHQWGTIQIKKWACWWW